MGDELNDVFQEFREILLGLRHPIGSYGAVDTGEGTQTFVTVLNPTDIFEAGHPLAVRFQPKKDGSLQLVNYEFVHEC
jgi:hypothetical protein